MLGDRGTMWGLVNGHSPTITARGDLDGDGRDELVASFGPGLCLWMWGAVGPRSAVGPFGISQDVGVESNLHKPPS